MEPAKQYQKEWNDKALEDCAYALLLDDTLDKERQSMTWCDIGEALEYLNEAEREDYLECMKTKKFVDCGQLQEIAIERYLRLWASTKAQKRWLMERDFWINKVKQ
jgi:hypothetical protein